MRPSVHFTADTGWINDPHGITFYDGHYHLFHQYVPDSLIWAPNCHWGHAVSTDLLTWKRRGIAIAPGEGDDGIWTGSLVISDDGDARIFYTSVAQPDIGMGRIRVAFPTDDGWDSWRKGDILIEPPADLDLIAYRDPFVVREGQQWRMYVGAGTRAGDALALTYTSTDLDEWSYDGVAASRSTNEREPVWMGALWECPQVVEIDDRAVLVSSVWDDDVLFYAGYGIGSSPQAGRFEADTWGRLSHGRSYYAPSFFRDVEGRPSMMFWMRDVKDEAAGWTSALSLPYVLSVEGERLVAQLHPDVAARRRASLDVSTGALEVGATAIDIEWAPEIGTAMRLLASGGEVAAVTVTDDRVTLSRSGADTWDMPYDGGELRVVVDGPVIEISGSEGVLGGPVQVADAIELSSASAWSL